MFQDFPKSSTRACHSSSALLAQAELMALHHAGRIPAAEIAGDRSVWVARALGLERTSPASAGCRI